MKNTTKKIVAFIDILGFSEMIKEYDNGTNTLLLNDIIEAVDKGSTFLSREVPAEIPLLKGFSNWKQSIEVKGFSDCFCISAPLTHNEISILEHLKLFYQYVVGFQLILLQKGYFVRGGITIGSYYSDKNIIFSGGLVDAYELENKKAQMPRIIVSEKFIDYLQSNHVYCANYMLVKENEIVFLNPFNYNVIDSEYVDKIFEAYLSKTGISGSIDRSFVDIDKEEKDKTLDLVLSIVNEKIKKYSKNDKIIKKYDWFKSFIDYEKGNDKSGKFEKFTLIIDNISS